MACGFYPYGEDVRYRLLAPADFGYRDLTWFVYSSDRVHFYADDRESATRTADTFDSNVLQWAAYCRNEVSREAVQEAVYRLPFQALEDPRNGNAMLQHLRRNGDSAALRYLLFAKSCEVFNSFTGDPWERDTASAYIHRNNVAEALRLTSRERNPELRRRYAFLAIRMSYYIKGGKQLAAVYRRFFSGRQPRTAIDYYALYFRALAEPDKALQNFLFAQVFAQVPEKRYAIYLNFNYTTPEASALCFARTDTQRVAVRITYAMRNPGRALEKLEAVDRITPDSRLLDFLLLRELNKLEDWIYTPTYTYFAPSVPAGYESRETNSQQAILRVPEDRRYAAALLRFVRRRPAGARFNPKLWAVSEAYLEAMAGNPQHALRLVNRMRRRGVDEIKICRQLRTIWTIHNSVLHRARIPQNVQPLLMDAAAGGQYRFLFAVGRELEAKGATTDAAALYSLMNRSDVSEFNVEKSWAFWRTRTDRQTLHDDSYSDYFYYLDAQYSPATLQRLLDDTRPERGADSFRNWLYSALRSDRDRLYDQLGTKFIRRNDLRNALSAFRKVNDSLYTSPYRPFRDYLDANPFYADFYTEHRRTKGDTIRFTKGAITARLINYCDRAADPGEPLRAQYAFLAGNGYLNMTQYGNSWMMRRYYWTSRGDQNGLEDDAEYFGAMQARDLYTRAAGYARDRRFAALCLRMAVRCENYRLLSRWDQSRPAFSPRSATDEWITRNNPYRRALNRRFPEYADELLNYCTAFETYAESGWRKF